MTALVLRFKGPTALRQDAVERLRKHLPHLVLTPKTTNLFEVQIPDSQLAALSQLDDDWVVSPMTYADINPPGFDWSKLR